MKSTQTIAYLGPEGTFTEQALRSQEDLASFELVPYPKLADVLDATSNGEVSFGFLPIENAIEGAVNMTVDAMAFEHSLLIQREVELAIHLNLMAQKGTAISDVTLAASHPVANAQCRKFVEKMMPDVPIRPANSTSEAALLASQEEGRAAFAPAIAAQKYGLEILHSNIEDHAGNKTRFVLVSLSGVPKLSGYDKTSVLITEREDRPGALVAILQEFAARDINLSALTSRPVKTNLGKYCFTIDFRGHIADDVVANCLKSIQAKHADVKFLGSYPAADKQKHSHSRTDSAWSDAEQWMATLQAQIL